MPGTITHPRPSNSKTTSIVDECSIIEAHNVYDHRAAGVIIASKHALSAASRATLWYARHGRDCSGVQVPCTRPEVSRRSVYQVDTPIDQVRGEGNCGRATDRGKEACDRVRKRRVCLTPPGHDLAKAAGKRRRSAPGSKIDVRWNQQHAVTATRGEGQSEQATCQPHPRRQPSRSDKPSKEAFPKRAAKLPSGPLNQGLDTRLREVQALLVMRHFTADVEQRDSDRA